MARVEKDSEVQEQLTAMRGEMMQVTRREGKKMGAKGWGCLVLALVFLLLCAGVAWAVAATGIVNIPGLTQVAYQQPAPIRDSTPTTPVDIYLSEQLSAMLTTRLQLGGGVLQDTLAEFELPDATLTASLRQALATAEGSSPFINEQAVANVTPQGVELYLPVENTALKTAVRALATVTIENGKWIAHVSHVRIGSLPVPDGLAVPTLAPAAANALVPLSDALAQYFVTTAIQYKEGSIVIVGTLVAPAR